VGDDDGLALLDWVDAPHSHVVGGDKKILKRGVGAACTLQVQ
jgi:hypothetical protein